MATVDQFIATFGSHSIYMERLAAQLGNQAVPYLVKIDSENQLVADKAMGIVYRKVEK